MRVTVLGPVEVYDDDGSPIPIPQEKLRQLVCILAVAGQPVPSADLKALMWETAATRNMLSALTTTTGKLRSALPEGRLVHDKGRSTYRLEVSEPNDRSDIVEFRAQVAEARAARSADPGKAADLLRSALDLWGAHPLPDLPPTTAAVTLAHGLLTDRRDAIEDLVEVRLALGHHAAVAREVPKFLAEDPLAEPLLVPYLIALYRDGRKADALREYERVHATSLLETGADPGPVLQSVRARIAANDPGLDWMPDASARTARATSAGIVVSVASSARIYDYLLGGDEHFPADRDAAETLKNSVPDVVEMVAANRRFMVDAARVAAAAGVRQFLDLGTGIPTSPNVHEIAWETQPGARVVYADNDPFVAAHNRAWRAALNGIACIEADIREPDQIIKHKDVRALIDPSQPVAVLMVSVLHFVEGAAEIVEAFKTWMAPGSYLAIAIGTNDGLPEEEREAVGGAYKKSTSALHMRSRAEIEALFDGLELLEPGVVEAAQWRRPDGRSFHAKSLAGVARKP